MKGGYQLLDLSTVTVGTKTKTKGSFEQAKGNNGKPVMVLTPDNQRVFAEVVESSGDYILAYLGGDGSTYTVLVEDDDNVTITKQESDASIATKVTALETAVGDVTDLDTTSKVLVGAINELNSKMDEWEVLKNLNDQQYTSNTEITMDKSWKDYKFIAISYCYGLTGYDYFKVIPTISVGNPIVLDTIVENVFSAVRFSNSTPTKMTIQTNGSEAGVYFRTVYGIL